MKKIVFTGGGTLGHVMPNVYIMEELKEWEISYIGGSGIEKEKMQHLTKYYKIPTIKLERGKIFSNIKIPFVLINAIIKAKKILKQIKPNLVFSKGGYVSLPVCIAAHSLKIPVLTHESDYSLGLANKIILKYCQHMFVNFKNLEKENKKIIYSGPIFNKSFESNLVDKEGLNLEDNKKTILIVSGSLGSKTINETIYKILDELLKNYNVIHITGKGNLKVKSYSNYNSFEMVDNIVRFYNIADAVIGRSGAGVAAECFYKQIPMLLIPLENKATRGDQVLNAEYYKNLGVAEIVREKDIENVDMLKIIKNFIINIEKYKNSYKKHKKINGKQIILEKINDTI